jgi:hypothetical protein
MGLWIGLVMGAISIPIAIRMGIGAASRLGQVVVRFLR